MTVIINEVEVIAEPPSDQGRDLPAEQRPPLGPTPQDIVRTLRLEALRRQRLQAS